MNLRHLFSLRSILCWLALAGCLCLSPDQLFTDIAPRSTTSIAPGSQNQGPEKVKPVTIDQAQEEFDNFKRPSLITQGVVLSLFSLLPFIIMILTSFLKMVVVLSLLRSALGVQQAPPNQIINGVAFMLSLFIMYPTGIKMYEAANKTIMESKAPDSLFPPIPRHILLRSPKMPASLCATF